MYLSSFVKTILIQTQTKFLIKSNLVKCLLLSSHQHCRKMSTKNRNDDGSAKHEGIEKTLSEWKANVKLDQLSDIDRKIHKTHLEAVQVEAV